MARPSGYLLLGLLIAVVVSLSHLGMQMEEVKVVRRELILAEPGAVGTVGARPAGPHVDQPGVAGDEHHHDTAFDHGHVEDGNFDHVGQEEENDDRHSLHEHDDLGDHTHAVKTPLKCGMPVYGLSQDVIDALVILEADMIERQERYLADLSAPDAKFVMYHCDRETPLCGGFGDRINGVVSAFAFAIATERAMLISWDRFIQLREFLVPNALNWTAPPPLYQVVGSRHKSINCVDGCDTFLWKANVDYPEKLLHIRTNVQIGGSLLHNPHPNLAKYKIGLLDFDHGLIFRFMFHMLFKPSDRLQEIFNAYEPSFRAGDRTHTIVGIHMRTGGDGHWHDPKIQPASMLDIYRQYALALYDAIPHLKVRPLRLLLVTDSANLLKTAYAGDMTIMSSDTATPALPISHLDRSTSRNQFEDHARTFLDLLLLANADALVISRSGFSEYASAINCAPTIVVDTHLNEGREFRGAATNILKHGLCVHLPYTERGNIGNQQLEFYSNSTVTLEEAMRSNTDLFLPGALKFSGPSAA